MDADENTTNQGTGTDDDGTDASKGGDAGTKGTGSAGAQADDDNTASARPGNDAGTKGTGSAG